MTEQLKFEVKVEAVGEVRDSEGNLLSAEPYTTTMIVTAAELEALGLPVPESHPEEK